MVETVNVKLGTDVDCRTPYVCMGNAATTKMPSNSATGRGKATECSESQRNEWASHNSTSYYFLRKYECDRLSHYCCNARTIHRHLCYFRESHENVS